MRILGAADRSVPRAHPETVAVHARFRRSNRSGNGSPGQTLLAQGQSRNIADVAPAAPGDDALLNNPSVGSLRLLVSV